MSHTSSLKSELGLIPALIDHMLGPNTTYTSLEGDMSSQAPPDPTSGHESFSSRMEPHQLCPPLKNDHPIPNLQAKYLRKQREQDEKVIRNLNRASHRLENQRAIFPTKESYLPQFVPTILPPKPFMITVNHTDLELIHPCLHSFDSVDDLLDQFPSPRQDSPSFSSTSDFGPPSPISQPLSEAQGISSDRKSSDISPGSLEKLLPSFISLIETSTGRLDEQRAEHSTRPRSWGSPVVTPLLEAKNLKSNRRVSLLSAIDRIRKESSQMFSKKKVVSSVY
ncbi:hypothetical protein DSO57_1036336 [Entomophthora muscae]|uniref:Uncharacterized protein n=1 Tax=Entomophthora muscae TaxID=34485 RepID=A0ACC2S1M5_9FUNG|nr:hypothetical protein DSO57_1036336 [Entomophthora muscae]